MRKLNLGDREQIIGRGLRKGEPGEKGKPGRKDPERDHPGMLASIPEEGAGNKAAHFLPPSNHVTKHPLFSHGLKCHSPDWS